MYIESIKMRRNLKFQAWEENNFLKRTSDKSDILD